MQVPMLAFTAEGLGIHPMALLLPCLGHMQLSALSCSQSPHRLMPLFMLHTACSSAACRAAASSFIFWLCIVIVLFTQTVAKGLFSGGTWEVLADGQL